ncbi:hypothetical protein BSIN_4562 [Burkholderia singularis]|uniref:Uncharacterized protein n=1 Tax=Burkholderia singularis TaxID=1503053 RepID=A0A238HCV1_9BURK|nr:hypothetical protein BSIN_4562 [Burkholderia singularis]
MRAALSVLRIAGIVDWRTPAAHRTPLGKLPAQPPKPSSPPA